MAGVLSTLQRIGLWALSGAFALICLAAVGLIVLDAKNRPPAFSRAAALERGKTYHVRIRRDEYGVPHVLGPRDADVAYGIAYAHAEDD